MTIKFDAQVSIVVPCYNEADVLYLLFEKVNSVCVEEKYKYELILVDDGSNDKTWEEILALVAAHSTVVGVKLSRNFGHQVALSAGLEYANGERILIIDADLQDPPELLPKMMEYMDQGNDVVYGQREKREGENFFKKKTASVFYKILSAITDFNIPENTGDFRLISKRVKENICSMPEKHRFVRGMIAWLGYRQVAVKYTRKRRAAGRSKYPLKKMVTFALDAIISFSVTPIRFSAYTSLVFALLSLIFFFYVIGSWLLLDAVPGWASLGFIITLLGACQLLVLGIIGEYIARIYLESKQRPLYLVEMVMKSRGSSGG